MEGITAYHGTCWEHPLVPTREEAELAAFEAPDLVHDACGLGALFFSDEPNVASLFADERRVDEQTHLPVMLVARLTPRAVFQHDLDVSDPRVKVGESSYHVLDDRPALYEALRRAGYQAFIMRNDYSFRGLLGSDIAIFDPACVEITGVRVYRHEGWSEPMSIAQAREHFVERVLDPLSATPAEDWERTRGEDRAVAGMGF
jgi:hypothetical protein